MAQGRIRPMPDIPGIRGFALCREWPQCRYGDRCTYAHGEEERRAWNALKFGKQRGHKLHIGKGIRLFGKYYYNVKTL